MFSVACAALAAFVPACGSSDSGGGTPSGGNTATTGNATAGAVAYKKANLTLGSCDSCHGMDTGGSIGPNISGSAAGLAGWTEEQFYQVVRNGKSKSGPKVCMEMPQFPKTDLSDQEIADIFAYTQSQMVAGAQAGSWVTIDPTCATK